MLTGNKGEWSEVYVFFRLLADGRVYAADAELNKLEDIYFPIAKILREEIRGEVREYLTGEIVQIFLNGEKEKELSKTEFDEEANNLLERINNSKGTFSIEETQRFMHEIHCCKLSASFADKSDITMKITDVNTGYSPTVGFSIKSGLGERPTLLNASGATNFIYKVVCTSPRLLEEINEIVTISAGRTHSDVRGRIKKLFQLGANLEYHKTQNEIFKDNLVLIDSFMDRIIAETLLYFYRDRISNCEEILQKLESENPMNYGNVNAYRYKFKKFLSAVALGMKSATAWSGLDEATGGYIVVTKEGDVLAYHIYNRDYFEDYLLKNTEYDTPSTSKYGFGSVYHENGEDFIKLNFQVRFKKQHL